MLDQATIDEVHRRGFATISGVFDVGVADDWRTGLAALTAKQRQSQSDRTAIDDFMVHNPMMLDARFFDVLEHPRLLGVLDTFLGPTSIVYAYTTSSMPAGGSNYSRRIHVDCPRVIPNYMSNLGIMIALDDFTAENGATYFLPESFERLDAPSAEEFFGSAERVFPRKGDLVVFNARTWHCGGANTTDVDRHALTINACRSYMRQRFDYPRLVGESLAAEFSPSLRRVLGFDVRVPTSLKEYYLPEDQRLYKANQG